jgi:hypothetical protein
MLKASRKAGQKRKAKKPADEEARAESAQLKKLRK